MPPIIFLDIDGVLNSLGTRPLSESLSGWLDIRNVGPLNKLITGSGARMVVSSTWRIGRTLPELAALLADAGVTGEIVATTPILDRRPRNEEIRAWLSAQPVCPTRFVILDDEYSMGPLSAWHVRPSRVTGLTDEDVRAALVILGLGPDLREEHPINILGGTEDPD